MRILICTGIFPPDIGGPAQYAKNLAEEFLRQGHDVKVATYGLEKKLPTGIRHIFYFLKTVFKMPKTDLIIALDTFSAGLPSFLAAKIFGKKIIVRVGGDFLWESYVERSGNLITLRNFYEKTPNFSVKEKLIFCLSKIFLKNCAAVVFSTDWQKNIFLKPYGYKNIFTIENFYGEKIADCGFREKNFIWAGRPVKLKNLEKLKTAFIEAEKENGEIKLEIIGKIAHKELEQKIQNCYAVILPSITDISPNFILDALRCNKPFILTQETGFYEKLKDFGIFVDPLNQKDIKEKILFLAKDMNYKEYKKKIESFKFNHSWHKIVEEFLEIYKKL